MKVLAEKKLFWFLKEGTELDLSDPSSLEMYAQQVMTRGGMKDVRLLLNRLKPEQLFLVFQKLKSFLPLEIRRFWEDLLATH